MPFWCLFGLKKVPFKARAILSLPALPWREKSFVRFLRPYIAFFHKATMPNSAAEAKKAYVLRFEIH
jgi:hypothetical protein